MSQYTFFKKIPNVFELQKDLMKKEEFTKPEWVAIGEIVANKTCDDFTKKDRKTKESVMTWIREKAADHNRENPTDLIGSSAMRQLLINYNIEFEKKQRDIDSNLDDSIMRNQQNRNLPPILNLSQNLSNVDFLNNSQNSEFTQNNDSSFAGSELSGNNGNNNNNNNNAPYSADLNTNTGRTPTKLRTEKNAQRSDLNRAKLLEMSQELSSLQTVNRSTLERLELKINEAMKFTSGSAAHQSSENDKLRKKMDNLNIVHNHKLAEFNKILKQKERVVEALKLETAQLRAEKEKFETKRREFETTVTRDIHGNVVNDPNDLMEVEQKMERHENKMRDIYKELSEKREKLLNAASANYNPFVNYDIDEEDKGRVVKVSLPNSEKFTVVDFEKAIIGKLVEADIDCNKYVDTVDNNWRIKICSFPGGKKVARVYFCDSFGAKAAIQSIKAVDGDVSYWKNSKEMDMEKVIQKRRMQQMENVAHLDANNNMYSHYDPTQSAMYQAVQDQYRRSGNGRGRGERGRGRGRGNYAQRGGYRRGRYQGNNQYNKNNRYF